ncbi:MAG: hypothetical protein LBB40_04880, partial [Holophagales bacterium]|nr:hypothetical protein [Holophagales bacterium]
LTACPATRQVRDALISVGGDPMLCGSGSCWAARFMDKAERDTAMRKLSDQHSGWRFYSQQT